MVYSQPYQMPASNTIDHCAPTIESFSNCTTENIVPFQLCYQLILILVNAL